MLDFNIRLAISMVLIAVLIVYIVFRRKRIRKYKQECAFFTEMLQLGRIKAIQSAAPILVSVKNLRIFYRRGEVLFLDNGLGIYVKTEEGLTRVFLAHDV